MSSGQFLGDRLDASDAMAPIHGSVEIGVPVQELWRCFSIPEWWPRWNKCFFWAHNRDVNVGDKLVWCFQPIRRAYLYKMPAVATIVEVEPNRRVTWEVTALPGFSARHTYFMEDLGSGRTRFGSWEKAMGWSFQALKRFWIAHFTFVRDASLEGAKTLEDVWQRHQSLAPEHLRGL